MNPRHQKTGRPPETVYGLHKGETIILVGNSSSLRDNSLEELDGYTTIGINRILRAYEPNYLFVVDRSVIEDEWERMRQTKSHIIIYPGAMSSRSRKLYPGDWTSTGAMDGQCDPTAKKGRIRIPRGGNSAFEATQVAYRMGAKRIVLAGIDMYWPPGKDSHFFGSGQKAGCRMTLAEEKIEDFGILKSQYSTIGVEITSISTWDTPFRRVMGFTPQESL